MDPPAVKRAVVVNLHPGSYEVSSIPRGYVLIINVEKYESDSERKGSTLDAQRLRKLFEDLGFNVFVYKDLNSREMRRTIKNFAAMEEHKFVHTAVLVILAHGNEGEIEASDGNHVAVREVLEYFNSQKCPNLYGKPKLIIFQACRGSTIDGSYLTKDGVALRTDSTGASMSKYKNNEPLYPDFVIAYPTVAGYAAWRAEDNGAPFIRKLEEVFRKEVCSKQVDDMLRVVTKIISERPVVELEDDEKTFQTSQLESTLRKPFFLFTDGLIF
ncbi:unnamed protein product [Calicophoron daubneyi]|uniref:Caspase-3 n=1 Tax=Calicophoron daubneyi TaxID=300641 RepID=A0AAV2TU60_CALDB